MWSGKTLLQFPLCREVNSIRHEICSQVYCAVLLFSDKTSPQERARGPRIFFQQKMVQMDTPFYLLSADLQGRILTVSFFVSILLMMILSWIGRELTIWSHRIPLGIVSLELPWSRQRAESIIKIWRERCLISKAVRQTRLDFLFLLVYPLTLSLACAVFAGTMQEGSMATAGIALSWAVLLCVPLDAIENIMLLKMLSGGYYSPVPQLTTIVAALKFLLVSASLLYMALWKALPMLHLS